MRSPECLHPEVFVEVWRKWTLLCLKHEATNGALTKAVEKKLWEAAVKITDYNIRLDWNSFCRTYGLGVYK
jgi:hypothetical protein